MSKPPNDTRYAISVRTVGTHYHSCHGWRKFYPGQKSIQYRHNFVGNSSGNQSPIVLSDSTKIFNKIGITFCERFIGTLHPALATHRKDPSTNSLWTLPWPELDLALKPFPLWQMRNLSPRICLSRKLPIPKSNPRHSWQTINIHTSPPGTMMAHLPSHFCGSACPRSWVVLLTRPEIHSISIRYRRWHNAAAFGCLDCLHSVGATVINDKMRAFLRHVLPRHTYADMLTLATFKQTPWIEILFDVCISIHATGMSLAHNRIVPSNTASRSCLFKRVRLVWGVNDNAKPEFRHVCLASRFPQ